MQFATKNWHQLSTQQTDAGARWTIIWDTKRRTETGGRNTAVEKFEAAALDRAKHLLRMGFVVYEIREPLGSVFLEEAEIKRRLGLQPQVVKDPPRLPPAGMFEVS
jgi:hypothetical protein